MVLPCLVMTVYWQLEQSCHTRDSGPSIQPVRQPQPVGVGLFLLFSHSVVSNSLWLHGLLQARLPCPSLSPGVCANSCPLSQWCHPTISSSITLFFCPQSFPAPGVFLFFASGGQSIGASTSALVLSMNIQGWFPLGLTGLILVSMGLSKVFSSTTVWKHQFFGTQLSLSSNSHKG